MTSRRTFIKNTAMGVAGATLLTSANSYGMILGANDKIKFAIIGCGGRAYGLAKAIGDIEQGEIAAICDVDATRLNAFKEFCKKDIGSKPKTEKDFRNLLEDKNIDAIVVATPEHWHAPMAIMGMQAGKHVYVEKPCSHNPHENELIVEVQKKYGMICQMGNQQRSSRTSALAVQDIRNGIIGDVYAAKAVYANARKPIGIGKEVPVPETLDWDLWQGPAPREVYRDNVHPYNWHWFRAWGTGEIHNNGTHEIDICRWALGVDYPNRVVSSGGRLSHKDDWEFFDTQMVNYEFDGGKLLTWDGRSCNAFKSIGGRGAVIFGTEGSIHLDRSKYVHLDINGKKVNEQYENQTKESKANKTSDTIGFDGLTVSHMQNFINAILKGEKLNSPIADAAISTQLCHLGNIAQDLKESLNIDIKTGRVLNNKGAEMLWKRDYEKGWEPKL
ncbi:Gfo/Idh/MocA family oxidoreductase [Tamlana fucoidanivorans]|uniref:Gfo/Idh/MocA family oxidoreductase n=1 Tax=Allotamlana fucoidanivorans TaxID=2583814 RepID=A0A5C4SHY1_9FLAO|nr:Gfo/Idh/MocA family oxidoreductase [Tamlana fucoidanivorans]TNJ43080.1 Gfo/Idh/MocA family oxidoreductase [Tamlana fucoidanivorans]